MKLNNTSRIISGILLTFLLFSFIACNGRLFSNRGTTVDMKNRIALTEGGPNQGQWQTPDLLVKYQYEQNADILQLSCKVDFANHLIYNYQSLDHFYLAVYFLDEAGSIKGNKVIYIANHQSEIENVSFKHDLVLPSGTTGMVFGYDGRASEGGIGGSGNDRGGGISWDFWKGPYR